MSTSWDTASERNTIAAYTKFLRDNPDSEHATDAAEIIEVLRVQNHLTINFYEEFVGRYPDSSYLPGLKAQMAPLYFERARAENTSESYRAFLEAYSEGDHARRAVGNLAYVENVRIDPTATGLQDFVAAYPESDFTDEARASLELFQFRRATNIEHVGLRVEVSPNVAQPNRVRRGFAAIVAAQYRDLGIEVELITQGAAPTDEMDGWLRLDYEESEASGLFGGQTLLSRCRVRLFHKSEPDAPVWDRTFEAPAEHILKGAHGRDKTLFGNARYQFWDRFFIPVSTWATSSTRVNRMDFLEDVAAIDIDGDRAALLFKRGGFNILDVSSPLEPKVIDRYRRDQDLSRWSGIKILDEKNIAIFGPDGVEVVERTEAGPKVRGKWEVHDIGAVWGADIFGSTLLVSGAKGIHAIRLEQSVLTPHRMLEGEFVGVVVRDPYIYLARPNRIEVTAPKYLMRHLSGSKVRLGNGFNARKMRIEGDLLYLVGESETVELSLENPGRPTIAARLDSEKVGSIADVIGIGSHLYLLGDRGLQIAAADGAWVSDSIQVEATASFERKERYAFLIGQRTLEILDLGPYSMSQVGTPASVEKSSDQE
ncbi:MAG: hypothetical protein GY725_03290 [bacterium]|nr:hypothetical protein [bacterium]